MKQIVDTPAATRTLRSQYSAVERQLKQDYFAVLRDEAGRRVLWDIIDKLCNLHGSSYAGSRENTFYCEGQRSVGIVLMQKLKGINPALYVQMVSEAVSLGITEEKIGALVDAVDEKANEGEIE